MIPFARDGDAITARFTRAEAAVLRSLCAQLVDLLGERDPAMSRAQMPDDADAADSAEAAADLLFAQLGIGGPRTPPLDPALARLLPDAYRGDDEASSDHRRLTERSLIARKVANATAVAASLEVTFVSLDDGAVQSWLRTLTDIRLVIAARLQIEEDGDVGLGDEEMLTLYDWLGYLQGTLLDAWE